MISFRKANQGDARAICSLISSYQFNRDGTGSLISMHEAGIVAVIGQSGVFVVAENGEGIVGCCSIVEYPINGERSAEVRSLSVRKEFQLQGIGSKLVGLCKVEAESMGISALYALVQPERLEFFTKQGFDHVYFPQEKIWRDCYRCPRYGNNCNEIPLVNINGVNQK
ncbi:GNAT family N-acetyltransferase [Candidatus Woesearchaeota archaeon]|nr:GNAT family N-acetyltransferase [Candidatus Woesearchaeota archaeon]